MKTKTFSLATGWSNFKHACGRNWAKMAFIAAINIVPLVLLGMAFTIPGLSLGWQLWLACAIMLSLYISLKQCSVERWWAEGYAQLYAVSGGGTAMLALIATAVPTVALHRFSADPSALTPCTLAMAWFFVVLAVSTLFVIFDKDNRGKTSIKAIMLCAGVWSLSIAVGCGLDALPLPEAISSVVGNVFIHTFMLSMLGMFICIASLIYREMKASENGSYGRGFGFAGLLIIVGLFAGMVGFEIQQLFSLPVDQMTKTIMFTLVLLGAAVMVIIGLLYGMNKLLAAVR